MAISNDPLWYTRELKHLKNLKNKMYKRAKQSGDFDQFKIANENFSKLQSELYMNYISRIQEQIRHNPKHVWRFVNGKR